MHVFSTDTEVWVGGRESTVRLMAEIPRKFFESQYEPDNRLEVYYPSSTTGHAWVAVGQYAAVLDDTQQHELLAWLTANLRSKTKLPAGESA